MSELTTYEHKFAHLHCDHPGGPDIANAFFRAGLIEAWGRGLEKIFEACIAAKIPPPGITAEAGGIWFEFPFHREQITGGSIGGAIELTERQNEIIQMVLADSKVTYRQIAQRLAINDSVVIKHIKVLREKGVLKRVGGTRGHWELSI